jgi:hypothetical protein
MHRTLPHGAQDGASKLSGLAARSRRQYEAPSTRRPADPGAAPNGHLGNPMCLAMA